MKVLITLTTVLFLAFPAWGDDQLPAEPGEIEWGDGTRYFGGLKDGKRHGQGTILWPDGSRFEGRFVDDRREGPGRLVLADGRQFEGVYENDVLTETAADEELVAAVQPEEPVGEPEPVAMLVSGGNGGDGSLHAETVSPVPASPDISELEQLVDDWRAAWSDRNVTDYLAFYSDSFDPANDLTRNDWVMLRESRLTRPSYIRVQTFDEAVEVIGPDTARITFRQSYSSNLFSDETIKALTVQREAGDWKIVREESVADSG